MDLQQLKELNRKQMGAGLKGVRLINSYTLEDLGHCIGKDIGYISRIENGKMSIKFDVLSEILAFYNMSTKEFYDSIDDIK